MALKSVLNYSPALNQLLLGQARSLRKGPPYTDIECVRVIQGGLNHLKMFPSARSFRDGRPDGLFGAETEAAVKTFQKTIAFPGQPREWDGVIGRKTLFALDDQLPVAGDVPDTSTLFAPTDLIIYVTGTLDGKPHAGRRLEGGDTGEFDDVLAIQPRAGFGLAKLGFGGTLVDTWRSMPAIVTAITAAAASPTSNRVILYGYSAGAKQLMEACREVERTNQFPSAGYFLGLFNFVDLLITVDAASGLGSGGLDRSIAGCVRRNENYFQTSRSLAGSHGAPNHGLPGAAGMAPVVSNYNMNSAMKSALPTRHHGEIHQVTHPEVIMKIKRALAAP